MPRGNHLLVLKWKRRCVSFAFVTNLIERVREPLKAREKIASLPRPVGDGGAGAFPWRSEGLTSGEHRLPRKGAAMKTSMSFVALGFGLFTATIVALAQTISTVVAQGPSSAPPSGVLATPPAAPVSVPPSGVLATPPSAPSLASPRGLLATVEPHRVGSARPIRTTHNTRHLRSKASVRSHPVQYSTASRRHMSTPPTIFAENTAPAPVVDRPPAGEDRSFLWQLGKAKEPAL